MRKRILLASVMLLIAAAIALPQGMKELKALLVGYQEVPSISTAANGEFRARISKDESRIDYELTYSDLEADVTQAHIHLDRWG